MRIVIIGAGNVGTNLLHAFEIKGIKAELISSRDDEQLAALSSADAQEASSAVYIYTVADKALEEVAGKVKAPKALHLHTSGTMPLSVFGEDKPHAGVLYFFQSFSKTQLIDDWSGIPCFIEGRNIDDVAAIYSLAQNLTGRIYETEQHDRQWLHIAGVFASNFTNLMYRIDADLLKDTKIPFEVLLPLIDQTAAKVHTLTPADAQTGPAQRGDLDVMIKQLSELSDREDGEFIASDLQLLYLGISHIIQNQNIAKEDRTSVMDLLSQAVSMSSAKGHGRQAQARRRGTFPEE